MNSSIRECASRLAAAFGRGRHDARLNDEIRTHLDLLADEYVRRGMSPEEARAAARREFGGVDQTKEAYREQRGFMVVDDLVQDVRFAARMLWRSPLFGLTAVLSLSCGSWGDHSRVHGRQRASLPRARRRARS